MSMVDQAQCRRGRPPDPRLDAMARESRAPRRALANSLHVATAATALGPAAVSFPKKVQVELGRILSLEGWRDEWTRALSATTPVGEDATRHHTPEIREWLATTGMSSLLAMAQGMLQEGLGADGAAQRLRNGRLAHTGRAARGADPKKAAARMAATIRREAAVHGMSLGDFIGMMEF